MITDPRTPGEEIDYPKVSDPDIRLVDISSIMAPREHDVAPELIRGPNIKPFPQLASLSDNLQIAVANTYNQTDVQ